LLLAVCGGVQVGCSGGDSAPKVVPVNPVDIGPTCAGYTACTNHMVGFSACYMVIDSARIWDLKAHSINVGTSSKLEWINTLSGIQNTRCVAQANGDCKQVLSCVNQGRVVLDCTPPEGAHGGRYCRDENTVAACTPTYRDGRFVESSVRCDDIGMKCVEFERNGETFAGCGYQAGDHVDGISVSCDGTMARVQQGSAYWHWDCALMNAWCVGGSYLSWDNYDFCESDTPLCDPDTLEKRCHGTSMSFYCDGRENRLDCAAYGQICQDTRILMWTTPFCVYAHGSCNSYSFQETCEDGVITYCGPEGVTTLDCREYGYSTCTIDVLFAHCQE
jgi:hypothetical protein